MKESLYYFLKKKYNPAIWLHAYLECLAEKRLMRVLPYYQKHLQHELNFVGELVETQQISIF